MRFGMRTLSVAYASSSRQTAWRTRRPSSFRIRNGDVTATGEKTPAPSAPGPKSANVITRFGRWSSRQTGSHGTSEATRSKTGATVTRRSYEVARDAGVPCPAEHAPVLFEGVERVRDDERLGVRGHRAHRLDPRPPVAPGDRDAPLAPDACGQRIAFDDREDVGDPRLVDKAVRESAVAAAVAPHGSRQPPGRHVHAQHGARGARKRLNR